MRQDKKGKYRIERGKKKKKSKTENNKVIQSLSFFFLPNKGSIRKTKVRQERRKQNKETRPMGPTGYYGYQFLIPEALPTE